MYKKLYMDLVSIIGQSWSTVSLCMYYVCMEALITSNGLKTLSIFHDQV